MNQSEFLTITWTFLKEREKSRVQSVMGFGFAPYWLKDWREIFKPITKRSSHSCVITFDSHLKTALYDEQQIKKFWIPLFAKTPQFLLSLCL